MKSAPFWSVSGASSARPGFLGIEASWDGAARALFLAVTLLVVITFTDYGITWDEDVHNYYGILVLNYYVFIIAYRLLVLYYQVYTFFAGIANGDGVSKCFTDIGAYGFHAAQLGITLSLHNYFFIPAQ